MDRKKKPIGLVIGSNKRMYMDLRDVIRENALSYFPAKALFKFQVVCRDWKLQILSPFFAHNQSLCYKTVSGFFYQSLNGPISFLSPNPEACNVPDPSLNFLPEEIKIRASCKGLICCQARNGDKCYYICNPVTKQFKKLPKSEADHGSDPSVVLIFEPSLLNFVADFKLICAFPSLDFEDATEFEIFSSNDGKWSVSSEIFFASNKFVAKSGVYVDDVVYWQVINQGIVAFDIKNERTRTISDYRGYNSVMGSMNGKLCSAFVNATSVTVNILKNAFTNTMEMHSHTHAWEKKTSFSLDSALQGGNHMVVLFVGEDMVLIQAGMNIISFDMKTKESKLVSSNAGFSTRFFPYVNSLVCI